MKTPLCILTGLLVLSLNAQATTTWYMTASGTGLRNGSAWNNAFSGTSNTEMVNVITGTMQPGDTLLLGGSTQAWTWQMIVESSTVPVLLPPPGENFGDRCIVLPSSAGGTPAAPKYIRGVDRGFGYPVFFGPQKTRSHTAIALSETCSYLSIENLDIQRHLIAISGTGTLHEGIQLKNIKATSFKDGGFYFINSNNLTIENCIAQQYNAYGYYLHWNCHNVVFRGCLADCTMGIAGASGDSPTGFALFEKGSSNPPNTDITFEKCISRNNTGTTPASYPQGDGFMVQAFNDRITFNGCISENATDGAYDLKGSHQILNNCVAINSRYAGFKIWYNSTLNNCIAANNQGRQFLLAGSDTDPGTHTLNNCTLYCTGTQRGINTASPNNIIYVNHSIISYDGPAYHYYEANTTGCTPPIYDAFSGTFQNTSTAGAAPHYVNPILNWSGTGTNFDNTIGIGYNSTTVAGAHVMSVNLADSATNVLASSDEVGVVPAKNWNNSTAANELLLNVVDSGSAALPGTSVVFYSTNYGYANDTAAQPSPMNDDAKMMRGLRGSSSSVNTTATVTGVPYAATTGNPTAQYDVYVYCGGRASGQSVPSTLTVELQLLSSGTYATQDTLYIKDADHAWDGTYSESTAHTATDAVDGNEFVVFRNLTAPEFRIRTTGSSRTGISGFQVVQH